MFSEIGALAILAGGMTALFASLVTFCVGFWLGAGVTRWLSRSG